MAKKKCNGLILAGYINVDFNVWINDSADYYNKHETPSADPQQVTFGIL